MTQPRRPMPDQPTHALHDSRTLCSSDYDVNLGVHGATNRLDEITCKTCLFIIKSYPDKESPNGRNI